MLSHVLQDSSSLPLRLFRLADVKRLEEEQQQQQKNEEEIQTQPQTQKHRHIS